MVSEVGGQGRAAPIMTDRKQREKGPGTIYNLQRHAPVTYFLQLSPVS
jgi:hypothetical protein